ncbi:MAG: DNA gyrase subunit A [Actinomycetota bacterium]|nr:DNA gyrase subunit A [Actinomycetota bacterium]MCL6092976.1 DNA gyrase subunit A [Actinomycetota bacterium]MDA8167692.1 DNA gyrase subunit A [Actinomycetota bacterium]
MAVSNLDGRIEPRELEEEMRSSYLDYAMSVIVGRALPDVRDGLKPVHRRVLYAMQQLGMPYNKPYKKSSRVVGDVIGKYHPHGDAAVYDTMVRMVQDFSMRYPLVDGQGNFGSVDGDSAAAYRYTEARLSKLAMEMLRDIDEDTVDFVPNFDESTIEPTVLPSRFPNLLVNGSSGIAVGMATNIPPHNLTETIDAAVAMIDNPEISVGELMQHMPGPDFPTGGIILGSRGIRDAYTSGRGLVRVRAKAHTEPIKGNRNAIIVTELPYQVNKASLIEKIAELVRERKIQEISDLRDESDRSGMRVVVELKRDAIAKVVLNKLYKHTAMQSTFGIINLALVDGVPRTMSLREMLGAYVAHQRDVVVRRTRYELEKAQARAHILEGLLTALSNLDAVVKLIRAARDGEEARAGLIQKFELTEIQAQAILDLRLQKLTGLERDKIKSEHKDLVERIAWLKGILADEAEVYKLIKEELLEIRKMYGDDRRTQIAPGEEDLDIEDLIAEEEMVISITRAGYIKRLPLNTYRKQRRGGVGIMGMDVKEEDFLEHLFITTTHHFLLFFTSVGKVYRLKVHEIPLGSRASKGRAVVNLLPLRSDERIRAVIATRDYTNAKYLVMATRDGMVKKTEFQEYNTVLKSDGIIAINVRDDDKLIAVRLSNGGDDILLVSERGQAIRFNESQARPMGRATSGVKGIKLRKGDRVLSMIVAQDDADLFVVTDGGYGKRTHISEYPRHNRGGVGVKTIKAVEAKGTLIAARAVRDNHELVLISSFGTVIRIPAKDISVMGRSTQGVRVMNLREGDRVSAVARAVASQSGGPGEEIEAE